MGFCFPCYGYEEYVSGKYHLVQYRGYYGAGAMTVLEYIYTLYFSIIFVF